MIWGYHHFRNPHIYCLTENIGKLWENPHGKLRENMENTSCLLGEYGDMLGKHKRNLIYWGKNM
jgi:hypothetical protein